jgi:signal transduction histidine kinase
MDELRAAIGALREEGEAPTAPAPRLERLEPLVAMAADADVRVEVTVAGAPRPLPAAVDLAAYRIVQESLTNVVRHAGAHVARVAIRYDANALFVQVDDDGDRETGADGGRAAALPSGHGLAGMRERAASVGGQLEAGPAPYPARGFRVTASLPLNGRAS